MNLKRLLISGHLALAVLFAGCQSSHKESPADEVPGPIEIFFLGHAQEHHNSRAYLPHLTAALALSGIHITYSENINDLNPDNLSKYDGVMLYANYEGSYPKQEKALLDYVADGHAFIPIHCASFCFRESGAYVNLVGGQFNTHETATFTADIVKADHPAMATVREFPTWDETYVHHNLAEDIDVLMERVDGSHREPWTWVKSFGDGRVFYTAYGHDERTWSQPAFHNLIKQGVLWAVDDEVRKNWEEYEKDIPILTYEQKGNIPNYEKRDPAPRYQHPLSPDESAKLIQVPPGFRLELFAAEPDIINPIAMNWDERGRLWVIETVDYPNTVRDDRGVGDDRIKICEDTDGDGKADKFTIFAENLNIPTGFTFWDGGLVVAQAPYFLYLKDTDGDDRADVRDILIEGWGTFDTHAGPSNLQMGIDNFLYGVVGYSGFRGNIFGQDHEFGQGIYRFDPGKRHFEFLTNTSNNTWGLGISEDNSIFASTANNTHSVFMAIPNSKLSAIRGMKLRGNSKIDGHYAMQPITRNVRQVDVFNGFTAAAGHHLYTARAFPRNFWNRVALVCEPTGGLVHMALIERQGAGYTERDGGNLFASADEWVSPVEAKAGPDGAVWILDWYNFIVQHNATPSRERGGYDAENGSGNAYINPLRDRTRGRIWRVVPKNMPVKEQPVLATDQPEGLISALTGDNMFWRLTAQRLLIERNEDDVRPALYRLINEQATDGLKLNPGALHAIWTLHGLGLIPADPEATAVVRGALFHPSPAVRKAAIAVLPRSADVDGALFLSRALEDTDPGVQLQALLYFAERSASDETGRRLYAMCMDSGITGDPWLAQALYVAASKHAPGFIAAYLEENPSYLDAAGGDFVETPEMDGRLLADAFVNAYIGEFRDMPAPDSTAGGEVTTVTIRTIANEMKYDVTEFAVRAGSPVELVLENTDFMQHNLVIVSPGAKEKVGMAADQLAMDPGGAEQEYVPDMPEVLFATAIIDPEGRYVLRFNAPDKAGNYPFICTFPGHWRIMQGVMKVIEN